MILKKLSDHYFSVHKDKKSFLLESKPVTNKVHNEKETYAYVHEEGSNNFVRQFYASSDVDAVIKAEKNMLKEGHTKAYLGIYLGKTESGQKVFKDLCTLDLPERLSEELTDGLAGEISTQSVRFGLAYLTKKTAAEKQNYATALTMLATAASMNTDAQARKLLTLARRISKDGFEKPIEPKKDKIDA